MSVRHYAALVSLLAIGACASTSADEKGSGPAPVVSVNPDFKVDMAKAELGGDVWRQKACFVCHTVGEMGSSARGTAPDLSGVVERRDVEWIKRFLTETEKMIESDPIANALYVQYNRQKMPNMRLTEDQIEALTHYLQQQTEKKRGS
jgi:mono/diheme cytochrome c family protein